MVSRLRAIPGLFVAGLLLSLTTINCADNEAKPVAQPIQWSRFEWTGNRGSMFVPITFKGIEGTYWLQHDLGAPVTMLYEVPYRQVLERAGRAYPGGDMVSIDATISDRDVQHLSVAVRMGYGQPLDPSDTKPRVGTLGLDFYLNRILLIDFPNQRLATASVRGEMRDARLEWVHRLEVAPKEGFIRER